MSIDEIIANLNELTFTAIDFETANEQRASICSMGLVRVNKGIVEQSREILIKPKELRFTKMNQSIHGIKDNDVIDAPTFDKIWPEVKDLIANQLLLAHNADFDIDALKQTLKVYDIDLPDSKYICTQKLAQEAFPELQNYRLIDVANFLGIHLTHHNSLSDAIVASEIGLRGIPLFDKKNYNYRHEELTYFISKKASQEKVNKFSSFNKKHFSSELLIPKLSNADPNGVFYNKKVVFTGDLQSMTRAEAAQILQSKGADVNVSISRKTEIVVVGQGAGPMKMKKILELQAQGIAIRIMLEPEFTKLIAD